tara:strand:- start:124 stop:363 length:240 start_codon:yes stop_codon:yes gene_type:complete
MQSSSTPTSTLRRFAPENQIGTYYEHSGGSNTIVDLYSENKDTNSQGIRKVAPKEEIVMNMSPEHKLVFNNKYPDAYKA